jgi:hypothetical protein
MSENNENKEEMNNEETTEIKENELLDGVNPEEAKPVETVHEESAEESKEEVGETSQLDALSAAMKETEIVQEPEEEKKKDDVSGTYTGTAPSLDNTYFNKIRYINDGTISIDSDVEVEREKFNKKLSKTKIIDFISMGLMILCFAAVLLCVFLNQGENKKNWLTWLVLGISVAVIIFAMIITNIYNKKNAKSTKEYLNNYEDMINGYITSSLNVNDASLCVDAKVNDQDIIQAHYFHTINRIESRAVVEGKRNGHHFSMAEVAVVVPTISMAKANQKPEDYVNLDGSSYSPEPFENTSTGTAEIASADMTMIDMNVVNSAVNEKEAKKKERDQKRANLNKQTDTATGLFGKIYSYDKAVTSEEAIIICYMGGQESTYLPDNLTGFKAVKVPGLRGNIVVYAIDPTASSKFFDEEGVKLLSDLSVNEVVQSLFISINSYGSKIGMNLSDDIMQLPIKQLNHVGSYDTYKDCTVKAFAFVDHVVSKTGK